MTNAGWLMATTLALKYTVHQRKLESILLDNLRLLILHADKKDKEEENKLRFPHHRTEDSNDLIKNL